MADFLLEPQNYQLCSHSAGVHMHRLQRLTGGGAKSTALRVNATAMFDVT